MTEDWITPEPIFQALDEEFKFTLDPCADPVNAKCTTFFTKEENGLKHSWVGHRVFMNPPYGRKISQWIKKAYQESQHGVLVVGLLPASTDTIWFQDYILNKAEIRFLRGRIHFSDADRAPFPSMVVIWRGRP